MPNHRWRKWGTAIGCPGPGDGPEPGPEPAPAPKAEPGVAAEVSAGAELMRGPLRGEGPVGPGRRRAAIAASQPVALHVSMIPQVSSAGNRCGRRCNRSGRIRGYRGGPPDLPVDR